MKWTVSQIEYLKKEYPSKTSVKEIMDNLHKSKRAVIHQAVRLGLARQRAPHNRSSELNHRRLYDSTYYTKNRDKIYARKQKRIREYKLEMVKMLGGKCSACGYNKCLAALDFHHISGNKESEVVRIIKDYSKEKALKEAAKCILLCANCHRELHYKDP